ncbi:phosphotransferase [Zobellia barbeyronii]|uniref:Phosphotransferase n=1 Tax=Zobellia barbeyronii TaxID=2748009 RepID=A0ABS5WB08_9FLAO|nr:phosphotransferase [Zobellia barbeyronii]MBT2160527.1 phosphotransferase [Zobellia barbeyronii]
MTHTKVITDLDMERILVPYGIKMVSYKMLSGGSANTNYLIRTEDNAFVLTICDEKSIEETGKLASLLEYLKQHKFSTSELIQTTTEALTTTWNSKPVMLKGFIEGYIAKDISEDLLLYLGKELAQLHQIKAPDFIPREIAFGLQHFDDVKVYAPDSSFYKWLKTTQHYIENHINSDLPKALIHSDIFNSNIIVDQERKQATIMDFEEACYYYRVFDIGMMIIGTCSNKTTINLDKVANLLKGYRQEIQLLEIEKKALKAFTIYAATATAYWRHQNFNYVNFNPEMKNRYLEMKNLADYVMNLPDNFLFED